MYGYLLKLDAGRQQRVGCNQLKQLLRPETYKKVMMKENKLNASMDGTAPFAPTLIRPAFYPSFLNATDIKTIYWKIKNHTNFHDLNKVYINKDQDLVFEFEDEVVADDADYLQELLLSYSHYNVLLKDYTKNKVIFEIANDRTFYEA